MSYFELSKLERLEKIKKAHRFNMINSIATYTVLVLSLLNTMLVFGSEPTHITVGYGIWWLCTIFSWVLCGIIVNMNKEEWS